MKITVRLALSILMGITLSTAAWATDGIVGNWKTIDDSTHQAKAVVQITETDGYYEGKIIKLLKDPEVKCEKCDGARKDQPVNGMIILWGLKKVDAVYEGGQILDPKNGKIYSSKAKLFDGGQKLEVRGFLGFSLLGRTQTWEREQ